VFFKKIKKFLVSPKTSLYLILIIIAICFIGIFIPQITDKSPSYFELWKEKNPYTYRIVDRLQLNRVYTSLWFLCAIFLTLISLGYSLYVQLKKNVIRGIRHKLPHTKEHNNNEHLKITCKQDINTDELRKIFKKKRYSEKTKTIDETGFVFSKNALGKWGGMLLHTGIFLVMLSALLAFAFYKRGFVQIIKGDTFSGNHTEFLSKETGVFAGEFDVDFKTYLSLFTHAYQDDGLIKSLESTIMVIDKEGNTRRALLGHNEPCDVNGIRIYQSNNYGYTLSFVLVKDNGEEVITHFNLDMKAKKGNPLRGETSFPSTDYIFDIAFYPDITGQTFYITKPIVYLKIYRINSDKILFHGLLLPKQKIKIRDDTLTFSGIAEWSGLIFAQNPGIIIAYIGFLFSCAGAIILFGFPYKEICLSIRESKDNTALFIYSSTRKYPAIFKEEVEKIANHIRQLCEGINK
jgi:cytochrome c biogenesis protein ResB